MWAIAPVWATHLTVKGIFPAQDTLSSFGRTQTMRSFLDPKSATPKTSTRGNGMPAPITPGGSPDEVQVVSGPDLSLNKHGGRRGIPSSTGELASVLEQYRDESFSTAQKRAQSKGTIHVGESGLFTLEPINLAALI